MTWPLLHGSAIRGVGVAGGCTWSQDLGASPRTIEVHRARVMEKMGARSLSELVRMALSVAGEPEAQERDRAASG